MNKLVVACGVGLCLAGIAAAVALRRSGESKPWVVSKAPVPAWARHIPLPTDKQIRFLRTSLINEAAGMDEPHPRDGAIVVTRQRRFLQALGDDETMAPASTVYVLSARANFTAHGASRPPGAAAPVGSFMIEVLDAKTLKLGTFELRRGQPPDISKLGRTIRLDLGS